MKRRLTWAIALALAGGGAHADIYHFVDDGVPHYSDRADDPRGVIVIREPDTPTAAAARRPAGASPAPSRRPADPLVTAAIDRAAATHGVDAALLHAVVQVESAYDARAVSPKGAGGLMQLMPATARSHGVGDVFDVDANVDGGARHLRRLLDRYRGDLTLTLAAYNAGDGAVRRFGGVPPYAETRRYVDAVQQRLARLRTGS